MNYLESEAKFQERYVKSITSNEFSPRIRHCTKLFVINIIKQKKCKETARSRSVISVSFISSSFRIYAETGFTRC